jgi:3-oxoacyl-[acyl-carrier protein] reductase
VELGLRDRVAIVTGSSRGIGRATAEALAAEGARVVLNARGAEVLEQTARELRAQGGQVLAVPADVMTVDGCEQLVRTTLDELGQVDILINNVGGGAAASVTEADDAWQAAYDWTFWPSLRLSRLVAPHLRRQRRGVIVMVASIYGRERGGRAAYQVVKSAQISLAKALALELAPDNVRVLSVAPGSILFPGGSWWRRREADPEAMAAFVQHDMPLGRFGTPREVGDVICFLCSDRASLMTGASVQVDGGQSYSLL